MLLETITEKDVQLGLSAGDGEEAVRKDAKL